MKKLSLEVVVMEELAIDVLVIGTGPAGQKAAIQSSKLGKSVIVVEKDKNLGGACLNTGTIPSKTLREAILDLTGYHQHSFYGRDEKWGEVTIQELNYRLNWVLEQERQVTERHFKKNNIRILKGCASFETPERVSIKDSESDKILYLVKAERIIIATGSKPRTPIEVPFDSEVIFDSTALLKIDRVPKSMVVLGGGVIGSEYASFFAALGTEVTVIDKKDHMLPFIDSEIGIHLQTNLSDIGLRFMGKKRPQKVERIDDRAVVTFEDGGSVDGEVLLYSLGRVANVESLRLENAGLEINERGHITVNTLFQTAVPHIYAVGDVIGKIALASTSMEQGRLAARHACGAETSHFPKLFPLGIYTIPEISSCGYTEEDLIRLGFRYEVGRAYYYEIARSQIAGNTTGMFKIIFHAETLDILGVHVIGRGATEVIHIGQVAMTHHATIDYFINQVFNYPTYAEGYRIAALNGFNKIKHRR